MPVVAGEMPITGVLGVPRSTSRRHVFRGGNFFMPRIFNASRDELGVAALPQELDTASAADHRAPGDRPPRACASPAPRWTVAGWRPTW